MSLRTSGRSRSRDRLRAKQREPGYAEWHEPVPRGPCAVCRKRGPRVRHHVVYEQHVRDAGGDPWDLRNSMLVGAPRPWGGRCDCHANHHNASPRIAARLIPDSALDFAIELFGPDRAALYVARYYSTEGS